MTERERSLAEIVSTPPRGEARLHCTHVTREFGTSCCQQCHLLPGDLIAMGLVNGWIADVCCEAAEVLDTWLIVRRFSLRREKSND